MVSRRKLIVYYNNNLALNEIKNTSGANIIYQSQKEGYAIVFTENNNFDNLYNRLNNNNTVKKIIVDDMLYQF